MSTQPAETSGGGRPARPFSEHPDRHSVLKELHLRPFLSFPTPQVFHVFAILHGEEGDSRAQRELAELCAKLGAEGPDAGARFHAVAAGGVHLRWECHSEFATYVWTAPPAVGQPWRLGQGLPEAFTGQAHGGLLLVEAVFALAASTPTAPVQDAGFDRSALCVILAADGLARVTTDFRAGEARQVRWLIEDFGLSPTRAGRLVQRLIELEVYRCLSLLGLPTARRADPAVRQAERELARLSVELTQAGSTTANRALLGRLTQVAADLEANIASTTFRFGATRAYAELVASRLEVVREQEHQGYISLTRFLRRRYRPAIATCAGLEARQQAVAERLANTVALLRTRIQSDLEDQNRGLLAAMNRRSRLQLRLQQTVEGLSLVALSYYVVGLIGYIAKGAKDAGLLGPSLSPEMVTALSVPVIAASMWWLIGRARKAWTESE